MHELPTHRPVDRQSKVALENLSPEAAFFYIEEIFPNFLESINDGLHAANIHISVPDALRLPPVRHDYPNGIESDARYLIDEYPAGSDVIYVAFMDLGGKTSPHSHPARITEEYYQLRGQLALHDSDREIVLNGLHKVPGGSLHFGETPNQPALTLIVLRGGVSIPRELRHEH